MRNRTRVLTAIYNGYRRFLDAISRGRSTSPDSERARLRSRLFASPVDPNLLIRHVISSAQSNSYESVQYILELDHRLAMTPLDSAQFERLLKSVCVRAERQARPAGRIIVKTTLVEVADIESSLDLQLPLGRYLLLVAETLCSNELAKAGPLDAFADSHVVQQLDLADLAAIAAIALPVGAVVRVPPQTALPSVAIYWPLAGDRCQVPATNRQSANICSAAGFEQATEIAV